MIRNVFAAAVAVALLGATPAFATGPFVVSDGNGGLNVIYPTPSENVLGGAIATVRPGVEAGTLEIVTITPSEAQDPRAVMVEQGFGAGELRLVPLAAMPGAPIGG
jgi:hypothetical protein